MPMIHLRRGHGVRSIAIAPPQLAVALRGRMRIDDEALADGEMFAIPPHWPGRIAAVGTPAPDSGLSLRLTVPPCE